MRTQTVKNAYAILCCLLLLCACATTRTYEDKLLEWKGQNAAALIKKWGPPTRTVNLADGGRILSYQRREEGNKKFEKQIAKDGVKATPVFECKTNILVDSTDIIVGWKYDGHNCRAN